MPGPALPVGRSLRPLLPSGAMLSFPDSVQIYEVGPRDGLQNEEAPVPTAVKVEFVDLLSRTGLPYIEVTSFVHPRWIPQLADAEDLLSKIERKDGTRYGALVPNMRGLGRAVATGLEEVTVFVSASETHNRKNLNRSIDESLDNIAAVLARLPEGTRARGNVSMVFGCPNEGPIAVGDVLRICHQLRSLGVEELSLCDTIGFANPRDVRDRMAVIRHEIPTDRIALHFHDTQGAALANVLAGLDAGVRIFDSSIGGLGGCPYAPGAAGNVATEDLVLMLSGMGIETGVDLDRLMHAASFIEDHLEKQLPGRYLRVVRGACTF